MILDVHVLQSPKTTQFQLIRCRKSIAAAIKAAADTQFKINVWYLPAVQGNLGQARKLGYSKGNGDYVTYVDDDDYLEENAFSVVREKLESGVKALTTGENVVVVGFPQNRVQARPQAEHHLAIYSRSEIQSLPYELFQIFPDQFLLSRFKADHVEACVYNWCRNPRSPGAKLRANKDRAELETKIIQESKLALDQGLELDLELVRTRLQPSTPIQVVNPSAA